MADEGSVTAQELLEQGLKRLGEGDTAGARQTLERVDPVQLSKQDRVRLQQAMQDISRQAQQASATPATLLADAAKAQSAGKSVEALNLYTKAQAHADATEAQKKTAAARIAELDRKLNDDRTRLRRQIDEASADINAGKLDAAEKKLRGVKDSGVDLGWWDNERVEKQLALIAERRGQAATGKSSKAAPAAASAEVAPMTPVGDAAPAQPVVAAQPVQAKPVQVAQATTAKPAEPMQPAAAATTAQAPAPAAAPAPAGNDLLAEIRQVAAQEKFAAAQQAEREGNYRLAAKLYQDVLSIDANNAPAKAALQTAQAKSLNQQAPASVLDTEVSSMNLRNAASVAEFRDLMNKAQTLRTGRNFTAAIEAVQQAKTTLDNNQRSLPVNQYRELREEAINLAATLADEQRLAQTQQTAEVEATRAREAEATRVAALNQQQDEVQKLLQRAADLGRERKYDQAVQLLNQALFLDPNNIPAQAMKMMMEDSSLYVKQRDLYRERDLRVAKQRVQGLEETLPPNELMTFPNDWPRITERRLRSLDENAGESEANRRIALKLRQAIPINFDANKLVNVLEYIRNTTGVDIYTNWTALQNVGVEQDMPITLQLSSIPADQALTLVLQQASANTELDPIVYSIHEGIVKISTQRALVRTTVALRTYDIRDLLVQAPSFEDAPDFNLSSALTSSGPRGGTAGGGGGGGRRQNLFGDTGSDEEDTADREAQIEEIMDLIRTSVGKQEDWVDFGGDVSSIRELNGNLIVRTTPEHHREIVDLLSQLRETRAMQISVEGRFLLVDQNFLDEVGVDLDVQIGDGGPGDKWAPIKIGQDTLGIAGRPLNTGVTGSFGSGGGGVGGPGDFFSGLGFAGSGRALDFSVSYLSDLQVNLLVRATQAHRRAISLISPRITFFNGQRAFITVATQVSFISDLEPVPDADGFNPTLDVVQQGVVLDVDGTISADRRYVTLTVRPSLATINRIRSIQVFSDQTDDDDDDDDDDDTNNNNNNNNNTANAPLVGIIEAPELEITTLQTTVSVPDRGTLMLGGQRLVGEIEIEAGMPVLSKIPILNRLFTNRTKVQDTRTLLVLIKPTIIIQSEEEQDLFPGLLQNPSEFNVGTRVR
jgi:general secretion pathway protein D